MKDKASIENHINKALSSVEGMERATPGPYFYTRLRARLDNKYENSWQRLSGFVAKPVIAFATILLVICINIFAIYSNSNSDSTLNTTDQTDLVTVDEYNQVTSNIYDLENIKP